jgi:hypothetical protein
MPAGEKAGQGESIKRQAGSPLADSEGCLYVACKGITHLQASNFTLWLSKCKCQPIKQT